MAIKLQRLAFIGGSLALFLSAAGVKGQGTFQNLGFESATVGGAPGPFFSFGQAFPGWTGYVYGGQASEALYDALPLGNGGFSIIDSGWVYGPSNAGLMEGNYTAVLESGAWLPNQPTPATLAQTGAGTGSGN